MTFKQISQRMLKMLTMFPSDPTILSVRMCVLSQKMVKCAGIPSLSIDSNNKCIVSVWRLDDDVEMFYLLLSEFFP